MVGVIRESLPDNPVPALIARYVCLHLANGSKLLVHKVKRGQIYNMWPKVSISETE